MYRYHGTEHKEIGWCCNLDVLHRTDDGTEFIAVVAHHRSGINEVVPAFFNRLAV